MPSSTPVANHQDLLSSSGTWSGHRHLFPVRVYYENTDAGGVVYHSQYLNFAERARTEGLRLLGLSQHAALHDLRIAFVVTRAELDFRKPARLDDALLIETSFEKIGGSLMEMRQLIKRDDEILVEVFIRVVCVSLDNFRAVRIPASLRDLLAPFKT